MIAEERVADTASPRRPGSGRAARAAMDARATAWIESPRSYRSTRGETSPMTSPKYDLRSFSIADKFACTTALRAIGASSTDARDAAERVVRYFYEQLADPETGASAVAL